jgi:hypothetical protein
MPSRPQIHEIVFGLFMLSTWVRLAALYGPFDRDALIYLAFIVVAAALAFGVTRRWRLRLLFYAVAMNALFMHMRWAIPRLNVERADELLAHVDVWSHGALVARAIHSLTTPWLTELLSACYLLYFPYLVLSLLQYVITERQLAQRFYSGLFVLYGLGFLGYSFVPAMGPWLAEPDPRWPTLTGWWLTRLNDTIVRNGSNGVDVFPSLHCAVSAFILFFDRRHRPWRFRFYLAPCVGLWLSTVYLRYHYVVDCVAGFSLAALALWVSARTKVDDGTDAPLSGSARDGDGA